MRGVMLPESTVSVRYHPVRGPSPSSSRYAKPATIAAVSARWKPLRRYRRSAFMSAPSGKARKPATRLGDPLSGSSRGGALLGCGVALGTGEDVGDRGVQPHERV